MARGKSVTKLLLDSSQAALFAGIEIHNKPNISYRYPTATILIINAWELVLKAYVYKYVDKKQIYESDKIHTKGFSKILGIARDHINSVDRNKKFQAVSENLILLNDYRNSNVHFIEGKLNPVIFMLISKAVINYDIFIKKYFGKDITKNDNLIILPIGFKLPFDPIEYLKQDYGTAHNEYVNRVIQSIQELNEKGIQESIVIGFDVYADRIKDSNNADIIASIEHSPNAVPLRKAYRITDDMNAPAVRMTPDFPPLSYYDLRDKVKERYPNIKFGRTYNETIKIIKKDSKLCKPNYPDPHKKTGQPRFFYDEKAIETVIEVYKKLENEDEI